MKETEKIINQIQAWSQADDTDRASVVIRKKYGIDRMLRKQKCRKA